MKHFIKCSMVVGLLGLCACQKDKTPSVTPTTQPTPAITVPATPVPTKQVETTPVLTVGPVKAATGMPERKVKAYDESADTIPISEEYFSDAEFRRIISELVDANGDGMLSREEREAVVQLGNHWIDGGCLFDDCSYSGHYRIDGLEWLPNLKELGIGGGHITVCLDKHPSLDSIIAGDIEELLVFANECDEFEGIGVGEGDVEVTIIKCKNFHNINICEGSLKSAYFEETPNLRLSCVSKWCSLGTEAGVFPWCGNYDFVYPEEVHPVIGSLFSITEDGRYDFNDFNTVEWRGYEALGLNLKEWCEQVKNLNEEWYRQEISSTDELNTEERVIFFSPEKGSIYRVESRPKGEERAKGSDRYSLHYYIVGANGQISGYDSTEKLYEAAANPNGLNLADLKETIEALYQG